MAWRARLTRNLNHLHLLRGQRELVRRSCGEFKGLIPNRPLISRGNCGFASWDSEKYGTSIKLPYAMGICTRRQFSADISYLPPISDPDVERSFKDLLAGSWDEIPHPVIKETEKALSKNTDDKTGQEALANVFRAAEAVEHFLGVLVSLRMEIDDSVGLSGENVGPMEKDLADALDAAYKRYTTYLDAFGPDEVYLRKKVETELGTKMIQLKLRCGGLGSEWGKVTVLGTSGLSGSYVEHRA